MTVLNRIQPGDGDPRHGTRNGYGGHGCRCDDCREANAAAARERLARVKPPPRGDKRHGRYATYSNYGCRCPKCLAAAGIYWRGKRPVKPKSPAKPKSRTPLVVPWTVPDRPAPPPYVATASPAALRAYQRGRYLLSKRTAS